MKYSIQLSNSEFRQAINQVLEDNRIDEIVETGTFHGDGSTKIFADTGKYVFTIECNHNNYLIATKNLQAYQNVCVIHGLSLDRTKIITHLLNEEFNIKTNYDSKYPKTFYMREIMQNVTVENALNLFVNNKRRQLVFLDSAGGMGYLEFQEFMSYGADVIQNKILVLDDIDHIKHFRSVEQLKNSGHNVKISTDNRFAICSFQKDKL